MVNQTSARPSLDARDYSRNQNQYPLVEEWASPDLNLTTAPGHNTHFDLLPLNYEVEFLTCALIAASGALVPTADSPALTDLIRTPVAAPSRLVPTPPARLRAAVGSPPLLAATSSTAPPQQSFPFPESLL